MSEQEVAGDTTITETAPVSNSHSHSAFDDARPSASATEQPAAWRRVLYVVVRVLIPVAVLAVALWVAWGWVFAPPSAERREREPVARLVEVATVHVRPERVVVTAMGTVRPAQRVALKPQVSGRVVWVDEALEPGAVYPAGAPLVRVEERDFEIEVARSGNAVASARSDVTMAQRELTRAESDLAMEMGSQAVASREYELLDAVDDGEGVASESMRALILREPQLAAAEAEVDAARAMVASAEASLEAAELAREAAELDRSRTTVTVPFDAVVMQKMVDLGDTVGPGGAVAEVVGTGRFWVELRVPESELRWIEVPSDGHGMESHVEFYNTAAWGPGAMREGRIVRRLPMVDGGGQMAVLLAEIDDPLRVQNPDADMPSVLAGGFLRGEVQGRTIDGVVEIDRSWLFENDTVRVMTDDGKLDIRDVDVLYRGPDYVLVASGLVDGERVVTTNLPSPVDGMAIRVNSERPAPQP